MQSAFHLFIIHFLRFVPLEILLCLSQKKKNKKKIRYLKDMQILFAAGSKHQRSSKISCSILEACKYRIILYL